MRFFQKRLSIRGIKMNFDLIKNFHKLTPAVDKIEDLCLSSHL